MFLIYEVAHHAALLPLLACVWTERTRPEDWLIAAGFAVSWLADSAAVMLDGSWIVTKVYPTAQLGLFALALGSWRTPLLLVPLAGVGLALPGPDQIVTATGSVMVLWLIGSVQRAALFAYVGIGSASYLLLTTELDSQWFMPLWHAYQLTRVTAFALFVRELWALPVRWRT